MTYKEFWYGTSNLTTVYRKANYKRIERKNEELWLQGLYIYNAFGSVMGAAFAKKGSKPPKYMTEPIKILPKTGYELKQEQEMEKKKAIDALTAWADTWKVQHG